MSDWYSNSPIVGSVLTEVPIPQQWVDDVLCTAFDGGVGWCWYWCSGIMISEREGKLRDSVEYKYEVVSRGGTLYVYESESHDSDDENVRWELTLHNFLEGVRRWSKQCGRTVMSLMEDHDATDADQIVQYALFGEGIYG